MSIGGGRHNELSLTVQQLVQKNRGYDHVAPVNIDQIKHANWLPRLARMHADCPSTRSLSKNH